MTAGGEDAPAASLAEIAVDNAFVTDQWLETYSRQVESFRAVHRFRGEGLTVTPADERIIAAQACILSLRLPGTPYGVGIEVVLHAGWTLEKDGALGRANRDRVTLAWSAAKDGIAEEGDGQNVILHEFAHVLDVRSDGVMDGLLFRDRHLDHEEILASGWFDAVRQRAVDGEHLFDRYAATNAVEFFAVATEEFFERPKLMSAKMPVLFTALCEAYGVAEEELPEILDRASA